MPARLCAIEGMVPVLIAGWGPQKTHPVARVQPADGWCIPDVKKPMKKSRAVLISGAK